VSAAEGGDLLDLCDEARAPVSFSCRGATCGSCLVRVRRGSRHLAPPNATERQLLVTLGLDATHRLACQARVRPGDGVVELECTGPDLRIE
jgi:ferredoxin